MPRSRSNTAENPLANASTAASIAASTAASTGAVASKPDPIVSIGLGMGGRMIGASNHKLQKQYSGVSSTPPQTLSNPGSRHKRKESSAMLLAAAMPNIEGPTSTTKALMVSVICPRRIGHTVTIEAPDDPPQTSMVNSDQPTPGADGANEAHETNKATKQPPPPPPSQPADLALGLELAATESVTATATNPKPKSEVKGILRKSTYSDVGMADAAASIPSDDPNSATSEPTRTLTGAAAAAGTTADMDDQPSEIVPLKLDAANHVSYRSTDATSAALASSTAAANISVGAATDAVPFHEPQTPPAIAQRKTIVKETSQDSITITSETEATPRVGNKTKKQVLDVGDDSTDLMMPPLPAPDLQLPSNNVAAMTRMKTIIEATPNTLQAPDDPTNLKSQHEPSTPVQSDTLPTQQQTALNPPNQTGGERGSDSNGEAISIQPPSAQEEETKSNAKVSVNEEVEQIHFPPYSDDLGGIAHNDQGQNQTQGNGEGEDEDQGDLVGNSIEDRKVTPEEAAAVTPGEHPDENEINMEELLRITFDTLLREWHLLNVPTVAFVDHQKLPTDLVNPYTYSSEDQRQDEGNWMSLQVMVRNSSLGIVLERLERIGVGIMCGTVSIFKMELCKTASPYAHIKEQDEQQLQQQREAEDMSTIGSLTQADDMSLGGVSLKVATDKAIDEAEDREKAEEAERIRNERMIEAARSEWKNAATRLRIEQVREQIVEQAAFSFDFISLLTIASILAGVGLITDNTVVIVASMLVSPIMGPVLGLTFGSRIKDWPLVRASLFNECLALLGCVVVGALVGASSAFTKLADDDWPTNEMEIRGETTGLLTGIAIAIPSGMGVCLGILGGNTSSLVGVAISASLLPPAVNSGICWVYAIMLETGATTSNSGKDARDFAEIGAISFSLTVLNIVCIWAAGIIMFEIKEVAPTTEKSPFWARDLKIARELNDNTRGEKPPPINMSKIREGLKTALRRRRRAEKNMAGGAKVSEDIADGNDGDDDDDRSLISVRIRPLPFRRGLRRNHFGPRPLNTTWNLNPQKSPPPPTEIELWEEMPFHDAPDHGLEDNIRYVGLEDMATLLGFDQEDDEDGTSYFDMDHLAFAQRYGRGRYL